MATAVRMTASVPAAFILADGEWGGAVAQAYFGQSVVFPSAQGLDPSDIVEAMAGSAASLLVYCSWRPQHVLESRLAEVAQRNQFSFILAVSEGTAIRIGPVITPTVPCYGCYESRRRQHDLACDINVEIAAAYELDSTLGPTGFAPMEPSIAASLILRGIKLGERYPGWVGFFDTLTNTVATEVVSPVHVCDVCSSSRRPVVRSLDSLRRLCLSTTDANDELVSGARS